MPLAWGQLGLQHILQRTREYLSGIMLCSKAYAIHRKSKEVVQKHNTSCAKGSNGAEVIPTNRDKIHLLSRNKDQIPKNVEEL